MNQPCPLHLRAISLVALSLTNRVAAAAVVSHDDGLDGGRPEPEALDQHAGDTRTKEMNQPCLLHLHVISLVALSTAFTAVTAR